MRSAVLILLSLLMGTVSGAAQLAVPGPVPSVLLSYRAGGPLEPTLAAELRDSLKPQSRPNYWKEGALIGGGLGAIGGAVLAYRFCGVANESLEDCTGSAAVGGLLGAALLALPGALIGGQFQKERAEPEPAD